MSLIFELHMIVIELIQISIHENHFYNNESDVKPCEILETYIMVSKVLYI